MSSEVTSAIQEGFGQLSSSTVAGVSWTWEGGTFTAVQKPDAGGYDMISGETSFKATIKLLCQKSDFPNGRPRKQSSTLYRTGTPTIKFTVEDDTFTQNPIAPVFTMDVKLKHG